MCPLTNSGNAQISDIIIHVRPVVTSPSRACILVSGVLIEHKALPRAADSNIVATCDRHTNLSSPYAIATTSGTMSRHASIFNILPIVWKTTL